MRLAVLISLIMIPLLSAFADDADEVEKRDAPRLALDAGGHTAMVRRVLFPPGGKELITISMDRTIRIWDVASGEPLRVLRPPIGDGAQGILYAAALSPDGQSLAVAGVTGANDANKNIYVIALASGRIVQVLSGHSSTIHDVAFSTDGLHLISGSYDRTACLWTVSTGECTQVLKGHTAEIYGVSYSPDGTQCATASLDGTAAIWDVSTGMQKAVLNGHKGNVFCVAWSSDGHRIATGGGDHTIRLWDNRGRLVKAFDQVGSRAISSVTFTADSQRLLWAHAHGTGPFATGVLNVSSGRVSVKFMGHTNTILDGTFSSDGKLAATTGGSDKQSFVWNTSDGSQVQKLVGGGKVPWSAAWSKDGNTIAWGNTDRNATAAAANPLERAFDLSRLEFVDVPDGGFVRARFQQGSTQLTSSGGTSVDVLRDGKKHNSLEFSNEYVRKYNMVNCFTLLRGDRAAVGSGFGLSLFDTRSGAELFTFNGSGVWAVSPSPDGRYLLTAADDMTLHIWDHDKPFLKLFFADEEWVAWTPEGYYASSPGGEALMGWHLDNGPNQMGSFARASQFRESLYKPEAIKMLLRTGSMTRALEATGDKKSETNVARILPPTVVITRPDGSDVTTDTEELTVMAVAKQVGLHPITSMQLLLDGRPFGGRAGIKRFDSPQRDVRERFYVQLTPGQKHRIQVRADSAVSYGLSRDVAVTYKPKSNERQLPSLYVLSMGVKDYKDDDLDLHYADQDAKRLEAAFRKHGKGLFRKIETKLVINEDATQRGILKGLDWLRRQMGQGDVGVVYYSGHGDKDSSDVFHLMPHDVETDLLSVTGIPDSQIKTMVGAINGRVLMLLDACNSGAAAFKSPSNLSDDLIRDLVSDDFGITVMSSSTGKELSQESSDAKGGYFTIAFVEGLSGKADTNNDGVIYSSELANYVADRVKGLTNGQQHPVMRNPAGVPAFPLAKTR